MPPQVVDVHPPGVPGLELAQSLVGRGPEVVPVRGLSLCLGSFAKEQVSEWQIVSRQIHRLTPQKLMEDEHWPLLERGARVALQVKVCCSEVEESEIMLVSLHLLERKIVLMEPL